MARISAEERRADFVNAAVRVIAAHGIDGATTRRIAESAAAPLATLHYCYRSKEELFADVYEFVGRRFQEVLDVPDPSRTLADTARQILRSLMECYLESADFTAAALELVNWAARQHEERGIGVYDKALQASRSSLEQAVAGVRVDPSLIDRISQIIGFLADGVALNWQTYGDRSHAEGQMDLAESVLDAWLSAQLAPVPASPR